MVRVAVAGDPVATIRATEVLAGAREASRQKAPRFVEPNGARPGDPSAGSPSRARASGRRSRYLLAVRLPVDLLRFSGNSGGWASLCPQTPRQGHREVPAGRARRRSSGDVGGAWRSAWPGRSRPRPPSPPRVGRPMFGRWPASQDSSIDRWSRPTSARGHKCGGHRTAKASRASQWSTPTGVATRARSGSGPINKKWIQPRSTRSRSGRDRVAVEPVSHWALRAPRNVKTRTPARKT